MTSVIFLWSPSMRCHVVGQMCFASNTKHSLPYNMAATMDTEFNDVTAPYLYLILLVSRAV